MGREEEGMKIRVDVEVPKGSSCSICKNCTKVEEDVETFRKWVKRGMIDVEDES